MNSFIFYNFKTFLVVIIWVGTLLWLLWIISDYLNPVCVFKFLVTRDKDQSSFLLIFRVSSPIWIFISSRSIQAGHGYQISCVAFWNAVNITSLPLLSRHGTSMSPSTIPVLVALIKVDLSWSGLFIIVWYISLLYIITDFIKYYHLIRYFIGFIQYQYHPML